MFLPTAETSEKYLVRLHSQLIRSLQAYHRTQAQWERIVARALDLEDEVANLENADRNFLRSACKIRDSGTDLWWTYTPPWIFEQAVANSILSGKRIIKKSVK